MQTTGIIGIVLICINVVVSYLGLRDHNYLDKYKFRVDDILIGKDYKRLITSGFLHVSWMHLLWNMIALYSFSAGLEAELGPVRFLIIYFASLIGGNLLALYMHRNHGDYSAVGASGAISGIIFAAIAVEPGIELQILFLPFSIPAWAFGLGFVLFSIYGIKSQRDNIGHEAHLGGAVIGMLLGIVMFPSMLVVNFLSIILSLAPAIIFFYIIVYKPHLLLVDNLFAKKHMTKDERYNLAKTNRQKEIDRILDKISARGINSLTQDEKDTLDGKKFRIGD